ncbi:uncharacterized protein ATNIH1004_005458 [Aspergillus tanneri]|uniref:Retroviral polymerase SH3-like domain-containing protein n=1 Tax=Aspergillus tanneri TaxID=1220188 RepID=A0A5M9MPA5_9EURO|nr:uncharacterized protein ATNIH1004_005458 [Aspergillus tanneri]KAA8646783.1 hypothetical protein ATNIH1004_005458 [Aspergillus tanneri]
MEYVSRDQFRDLQAQLQNQQTQMQQIIELIQRSQSPLSSTPTPNPKPISTALPPPSEDDAGRASIIQAVSAMRKDVGRKLQHKPRSLKISNFADWKEDLLKDARIINAESILINKELNPPHDSEELNSAIWQMKNEALAIRIYQLMSREVQDRLGQTKAQERYDLVREIIDIELHDGDYLAYESKLSTLQARAKRLHYRATKGDPAYAPPPKPSASANYVAESSTQLPEWYVDTCASYHMTPRQDVFSSTKFYRLIAHIRPFGCCVWYYNDPGYQDFNKIVSRGAPGVYIGSDSSTNHKVYVKETNKVIRTGHVSFNEQAQREQPTEKPINSTVPPDPEHLAQEALHLMGILPRRITDNLTGFDLLKALLHSQDLPLLRLLLLRQIGPRFQILGRKQ